MVCCVFQATNLVNNYRQRKSERTFVSKLEASNKLYTVLPIVFYFNLENISEFVLFKKNILQKRYILQKCYIFALTKND